jgi:fatty acid desaturase
MVPETDNRLTAPFTEAAAVSVASNIDDVSAELAVFGDASAGSQRIPSDYARLSRLVKEAGYLDRRRFYYSARIAANVLLVAIAGVGLILARNTWWELLVAVYLAIVSTQLAFTGHEAGHRQMFRSRRANEVAGYLHGNLMIGLSYDWWVDKHNRHHRNPNHVDSDPDIGTGTFVFFKGGAESRGRFGQWAARRQAYFFFPLLTLESLNLQVASIRAVVRTGARNRGIEALLLVLHEVLYLTVIFLVMTPGQAFAFIAIHHALFGIYLGSSFAPNHKGMRVLTPDESMDFLRRQVLTSRNVRGGRVMGMVFGGLNWQIEHHLFPSMPRPNLRLARPMIRQFCNANGVSYAETSLARSYLLVLGHLGSVGQPAAAEIPGS